MNATIRTILTTTAAAAFFGSVQASETKPHAEVGTYELKKKSTFTLAPDRRAPFWPIGWVKKPFEDRAEITQAPKPKVDENAFTLTSIMLGNPSLAVVNGRAYSEGELVRLPKASGGLKVRVHQISDGNVTLAHEHQTFVVSLRRPELASRPPTEEILLSAERDEP